MKIGLVLSGGGANGAYEVGVWRCMRDLGISRHVHVFSGTSIGAFNSLLFAQNDPSKSNGLWNDLSADIVMPISKLRIWSMSIQLSIGAKIVSKFDKIGDWFLDKYWDSGKAPTDDLLSVLNKHLDFEKIISSKIKCYATCTQMPECKAEYFKLNDYTPEEISKIIMASATLPTIFKSTEFQGKKYVDGGLADNTPIKPAYNEGCDYIIVVYLNKGVSIDKSLYPNSKIIEIIPKEINEGTIGGVLNFKEKAKLKLFKQGYLDAQTVLSPIFQKTNMCLNSIT
ncbi:MAG: patatin-like phospholipase family protein [Clostridium perfringens]|nr:patatin-like phospholipase family protein [Clostridium perfringens]